LRWEEFSLKTEIIGLQSKQASKERAASSKKGANPAQVYSKIVERYAMLLDRPELRLRFLHNTLAKQVERQKQLHHSLRHFRFIERTRLYDLVLEARFYSAILEELRKLLPVVPANRQRQLQNVPVPRFARAFFVIYQTRHAFYAMGVLAVGLLLFSLYSVTTWSARHVNSYLAQRYQRGRGPIYVKTDAQPLGVALAGPYKPDKIWQVEKTNDYERYSNLCRINTRHETENHPRGYYQLARGTDADSNELRHEIIGIVYHASESDILPFISENNDSIQRRSQGLLEYIQKKKSYNYLIDRIGDIYRIVRDDHAAYHAGNSIWADQKNTYIGLNESFIGVCFESSVANGTTDETLTEAQVIAGRALTNVLRSKYNIDDANCTTHGLVSVNPDKMLIAFHHDWTRGFPFEAMGLSDKYKVLPPNMSDYGFTYDEEILDKLGRVLWPGALAAEDEFKKRADRAGTNPELLRRRWRDFYIAQIEKVRKLQRAN